LCISAITGYEIYSGATPQQIPYWEEFLARVNVLSFDKRAAKSAVEIDKFRKSIRKQIDFADLFIAAIGISNNILFATLTKKAF
jgi:predicted nucleic acid-binding protein